MSLPVRLFLFSWVLTACQWSWAQGAVDADEAQAQWFDQRGMTAKFRFSALVWVADNGEVSVEGLRVYDRKAGTLVQEFRHIEGLGMRASPERVVRIVDANFDGAPDIALAMNSGGAGPNDSSNYYLFNRSTNRFELDPLLSELTQVTFNRDKTLSSSSRGGCCAFEHARYRYINGRLTQLTSEVVRALDDDRVEITKGRRMNGRMQYTTVIEKESTR
ncbi:MAG: XAC2610-related protein [Gammaproteobacteria bacterium]